MNGTYLTNIDQLYATLRDARCVIAADSGPGHVAAQLGATVLSLFGPTDPKRWAPIGPDVHVLAPSSPSNMTWLEPERVIAEFNRVIVLK
jgi:ADP-heptose:LPS heptosyltransferase